MIRVIPIVVNETMKCAFLVTVLLFIPFVARAQDATASPPSSDYVSRAEYDKLKTEHEAMKKELAALKTAVRQMASGTVPAAPTEAPPPAEAPGAGKQVVGAPSTEELRQEVEALKLQVKETFPGTTKFLFGGYGTAGFTARSGEDPFFDASFNAIFLFKMTDRLFFEC